MALNFPRREVHVFMTLPKMQDQEGELYLRRIAIIHAKDAQHVVCHHHEFPLPLPMHNCCIGV